MRSSGVLLAISSLPSKYGIGCFSKEAYEFVDQLNKCKQRYWQILPLGPTGYGDSPYQSFSTFAGNPYFIDLNALVHEGLLTEDECKSYDFGSNARYVEYEKIYNNRFKILYKAFERSNIINEEEFIIFKKENNFWLHEYALYMAIKNYFGEISWIEWDEDIRLRKKEALNFYQNKLKNEILFYEFIQYKFSMQWKKLKKYANDKKISIIGDIPIYVAFDSADSWAHSELFQFDEDKNPIAVAGCPPDAFSATGQLWGNPLYNWEYHKETSYEWWIKRIAYSLGWYDCVRIDHFRGFDEYYSIPFGLATAEIGEWKTGPGLEFFNCLKKELGNVSIIAEDLGFLTESVTQLVKDTHYPGMKILEFAFDSREESDYLPHNYSKNCVVYTGTHDNDTIKGWYIDLNAADKQLSVEYMNNRQSKLEDIHWDFVRLALSSVANLAIIPVQDYLGSNSNSRMNIPSTIGGNWKWRLLSQDITDELIEKISRLTSLYGRG